MVHAALTIDFEYFTHLPAYRGARGTTEEQTIGLEQISEILEALESAGATATFFTVSEIAETQPDIINRITEAGHEIASHTRTHRHLSELSAEERHKEMVASRDRLESVAGTDVVGFRAPSFDIADDHFSMVSKSGYEYDSSIVPARSIPGWYGGEHSIREPMKATSLASHAPPRLSLLPVGVMPGVRLPLSGTWLRFFGVHYTILGMRLLARRGIPPVLYIHPWELSDLPPVEGVPKRVYARTGPYMRRAIRKLLTQPFEFVSAKSLVDAYAGFE